MVDRSTVRIAFLGDASALARASRQAEDSMTRVQRQADTTGQKLGKAFKAGAGAAVAVAGVAAVKFGVDSVKAYSAAEQSALALEDAFKRFPTMADTSIDSLRALNSELAKKTRFDDDATASGQAVLAQFNLTGQQVKSLTPLMQDYASKTGKALPDAADALGKAILGQGRALKDIGVELVDTGTSAGNFTALMEALRTQVGGFAEKEGDTAAGKVEILRNRFGELQEAAGAKLLPMLEQLADKATKLADEFEQGVGAGGAIRVQLEEVGEAARAVGDILNVTLIPAVNWFGDHPNFLKGALDVFPLLGPLKKAGELIDMFRGGDDEDDEPIKLDRLIPKFSTSELGIIGRQQALVASATAEAQAQVDAARAAAATAEKRAEAAKKAREKAARDAEIAREKAHSKALADAAKQRERVARAWDVANDAVRNALMERSTDANRIKDNIVGSHNVLTDGMKWTANDLLAKFKKKLEQVKRFQTLISTMVHKGFSATIIRQVAEAGPEAGMATAAALAGANVAQTKSFNTAQAGIERAAGMTGERAVKGIYGDRPIVVQVMLDKKVIGQAVAPYVASAHRVAAANGSQVARAS